MTPKGETEGFRVVDRRRFTPEGEAATPRPPEPAPEAAASAPGADLPPAGFPALVQMLTMGALDALGAIPGPDGRPEAPDLVLARHSIDLLGVLEEKTRGNLTADEARLLEQALFDLRMLAVRAARTRT